jgi:diguanylate cyclase (GGDEF)-like protein
LPAEVEPAMRGAPPVHASVLGGKSVLIGDTPARSGDVADRWLRSRNIRSCAEVLIGEPDRPIGVLAAHSNEPSRFNGSTIVFLQAIANTLAAASARHAASQRLSHLAQFDQLSGLANRALFDERLQHALTRARAVSTKLGVLFIDLDDFKLVNDRHGHQVGDQLLVHVAQRLQQCIRNEDTVGRIGGDEFAIVLTGLDSDADVRSTSRRIVDALERPFEIGDVVVRVGASIGVAVAPDDGVDHTALLKQADMAMYAEKGRRGRRTG